MILIDSGPLIAAFRRSERDHQACATRLKSLGGPFATTLPVLTECFHLLAPQSEHSSRLRAFVRRGGAAIVEMASDHIDRAFDLMEEYRDLPMDFADASLIAAAEALKTRKIFTLDTRNFAIYRIRRGHRRYPVDIV
ncbi:MAG: type II toxin-antitoxin system VapC family toxin [Pseudomonadota bacterium]